MWNFVMHYGFLSNSFLYLIFGFHLGILQLIWVGVNPKCTDDYAVLEWKNLTKLHIFAAKHNVNTYSEKLFPSDDCASILSWPPVTLWRYVKPKNTHIVSLYTFTLLFLT